jgi:hypothetical protein
MLAIKEQSRNLDKLVDIPNKKELLEKIRKKTNFAYQRAIHKSRRDIARKTKSKNLLRSDSKRQVKKMSL